MAGIPLYPKDMATEWMNLKKEVKGAFTSANTKPAFNKIAAGVLNVFTSLVVEAGASIVAKYGSGLDGIYFGRMVLGPDDVEGMLINDQTGNIRFVSFSKTSDGYGYTAVFDSSGNIVLSDDADAGWGIGRPWLHHTFADTTEIALPPSSRQTTLTTDTVVVSTMTPIQHPKMRMEAYIYIQTGGSTCNYKVKDVASGATLFSGTSGGGYVTADFDYPIPAFGDTAQIDITVRRASGTNAVGITVLSLIGRQS